jgi:hypothetical protein
LTIEDTSVGLGNSEFTVPAGAFKRVSKSTPKYSCTKVDVGGSIVDGIFDFKTGAFWIRISKAELEAKSDRAAFNLIMGAFSEGVSVNINQ